MRYLRLFVFVSVLLLVVGCPEPESAPVSKRVVAMPVFTEAELAGAAPLSVVAATPTGTVERVREADEVAVTFDAPMVELGAIPDTVDFPLLLEPDVPGTCHWLGTRTVVFRPDTLLPPATGFTVRVPRGVRSVEGRMLKQEYAFEFSTVRPKLENSDPHNAAEFVELDRWIHLKFNVPMNPKRAARFIKLVERGGVQRGFRLIHPRPGRTVSRWWFREKDSAKVLVLIPRGRLRIETEYRVVLEQGLPARVGDLGLEREREFTFRTFNRFRLEGINDAERHHPEDAVEFVFSNPVPYANLARGIRFTPEVKISDRYLEWSHGSRRLRLSLPLAPETGYRVEFSRWLKDDFGNRLGRDMTEELRTVSYRPRFGMPGGRGIVESGGKLLHPVWMVNIDSLHVRMRRLDRSEVVGFWRSAYDWDSESDRKPWERAGFFTHSRTWRPEPAHNQRRTLPMRLEPGLGGRSSGFLFCELDGGLQVSQWDRYRRALLQVTPYGLTAKFSPENGLGYVTRLSDAGPAAGVGVQLRGDDNKVLWKGATDEEGFVRLPGWRNLNVKSRREWQSPRVWMFVDGPDGEAFVHSEWGTGIGPYEFGINYDWHPDPDKPRAFLFTEKGLYRAGDTVRVKGMVRTKRLGHWRVPARRAGRVRITDPRGENVLKRDRRLSETGSFDLVVPLKADASSGYYSIMYTLGDDEFHGSFRVEAYRPAEFEVEVTAQQEEYVAGDRLEALVEGRYLFGAPMSGDRVRWSVSLAPARHKPPGHQGYWWGPSMDEGADSYRQVASGEGRLDPDGHLAVQAALDLGSGLRTCRVNCEATVTARNERSISGRESWLVHRGEVYVGVKRTEGFIEVKDSIGFDIITTRPDGGMQAGQNVAVTMFRRTWKSVRKAQTGGRYSWVSERHDEKVSGFRVRTGEEPVRRWFKPGKPGYYWLKAETRDRRRNPVRTDCSFWVAGSGSASWMMRDDDMIELVRDRDSYEPGDTARILVKSPWTGVQALVTIEREFVIDKFTTTIEGNAELVRIPITADYLPNVFVSVILLKGRTTEAGFGEQGEDLGKPGFKIGYVELPVDPGSKQLAVEVSTGREEYEPGDSVGIDLRVTGPDGDPVRAEVTLAVVDLGVLKLTGFVTPDPFEVFYRSRPLSVSTVESRLHVIGRRDYGLKGANAGGDGWASVEGEKLGEAFGGRFRDKFLETALWLPSVRTDAQGRACARLQLPDNLTTWKVIAVAATAERFGSGEHQFRANKRLLLQPSLPRFMRPGDEFRAGVMAHNRSDGELEVTVKAQVADGVRLTGEQTHEVKVGPGRPVEVLFDYRCTGGASAELRFTATSGQLQDGLKLTLPVLNPPLTEAVAVYEQTTDSLTSQWVTAPADVFAGVGGLEVTVASSGLSGLERGIEYLRTYPYDCLEQRLSKVMPFIVGEELINRFGLSDLKGRELRTFVRGELAKVPAHQDQSGGFHLWKSRDYWYKPSPYVSAYCMYVLARARDAGYETDKRVTDLGAAYLRNWLSYVKIGDDWPYSVNEFLTTRALFVYALALWGGDVEADVAILMDRLDQMSVFGKACLLKAVAVAPQMGRAGYYEERIVQALNNKIKLAPTTAHYEEAIQGGWTYHSNVRTTAAVLQALLATRGEVEFAEKAVKWLVTERRSGRWRTTQENVYVFDALAMFYRVYEKVRPDFTVTVRIEGKRILSEAFAGRSLESRRRFLPMAELVPGERQEVEIRKAGPGRLYYGMRLTYAPRGKLKPKDEGIRVEKTIRPAEGRGTGYERGRTYLVTVSVHTPQERLYVVVDDPVPAGFEIVNTSFATESRDQRRTLGAARREDRRPGWWGSFDHEDIRDDRYLLFATSLRRGTHTRTYMIKALTPGRFLMPPVRAEEMYTPEVFGYSDQQWIEVR